jgi:G:T/U-mismatch repair DNA glycosylase
MYTLILGSYPPHADKRHYEFFYPNKVNRFWNILAGIKGYSLEHFKGEAAVQERKKLMEELQIGVQNMGLKISRKGKSAADNDIEILEFQDILATIRRHPELDRILMPGYSGRSSTVLSFIRYLKEQGIFVKIPKPVRHGSSFVLHIDGREILCIALTSTSPRVPILLNTLISLFSEYIKRP